MKLFRNAAGILIFIFGVVWCSSAAFAGEYIDDGVEVVIDGEKMTGSPEAVKIDGQVYVPIRRAFEMIGKDVVWHDVFNSVEVSDSATPDDSAKAFESDFHLIASLPQEDIFVYGLRPKGIVVYFKGEASYVDTEYCSSKRILPDISYGDYNNDGKYEIALNFYVESESGEDTEELHVLVGYNNDGIYYVEDNKFSAQSFKNIIDEHLSYGYDKSQNTVNIIIDGASFECQNPFEDFSGLSYGETFEFEISKSFLTVRTAVSVVSGDGQNKCIGFFESDLSFKDNKFNMEKVNFINESQFNELLELKETAIGLLKDDLEIESIYNGALQGNWEYKMSLNIEESGERFFPAVSDKFHSTKDLEDFLRNTYSSEERINKFLSKNTDEYGTQYFKDVDGELYVDMLNGGKGMAVEFDFNSVRVEKINYGLVKVIFDYNLFDYPTKPAETSISLHNGKWLLDKGVYEAID